MLIFRHCSICTNLLRIEVMQNRGIIGGERIQFLDFLRVIACLMVILVHSCEFFYIEGSSISIKNKCDGLWVCIIDSALRSAVPLFVMASSYLLLPLKYSASVFYKKRFVRVVVPFVIWSVLYAVLPVLWGDMSLADVKANLLHLTYNFNGNSGHLWFVYMLIGLYLFMPILSPWIASASKKFEQGFLIVWFITTFHHYARFFIGDVYGECLWNEFHAFWYFSGFIGYLVLAHYIRTYIDWSLKKSLCVGIPMFLVGYLFTAIIFYKFETTATDFYQLELSWRFCSFNVALMAAGLFLMIKKIKCDNKVINAVVGEISRLSYGIYLMHIFVLNFMYVLINDHVAMPANVFLIALSTFLICCVLAKLISYLPKSKYIVG